MNDAAASGDRRRILIVEDDPDVARGMAVLLSPHYDVSLRASGLESSRSCAAQAPDVMLVDYMLPDGTGIELLDRLRQEVGPVPAVMVSAFSGRASDAIEAGFEGFVAKPFLAEDLIRALERALSGS